nr:hypothetical protein CFP56_20694 [Quercus suber]
MPRHRRIPADPAPSALHRLLLATFLFHVLLASIFDFGLCVLEVFVDAIFPLSIRPLSRMAMSNLASSGAQLSLMPILTSFTPKLQSRILIGLITCKCSLFTRCAKQLVVSRVSRQCALIASLMFG